MKKKNKGITLIALIVTIVVMLILIAVGVVIIVNSDLIGHTEKTASAQKKAEIEDEFLTVLASADMARYSEARTTLTEYLADVSGVSNVTSKGSGKYDVTYKGYVIEVVDNGAYSIGTVGEISKHNWQYTDNTLAELHCECEECKKTSSTGKNYKIGQQVKRTESDTLLTDASTATGTEWVVFGREDSNNDKKYETLLITTLAPSTELLALRGADGYNTGIQQIEAKVKELYGEEARSMTIDDVNRTLGYTPAGGMYVDINNTGHFTTTGNFTTKLKDLGDTWTDVVDYVTNHKGGIFYTPEHPEGISDNGAELGEYVLDGYRYEINENYDEVFIVPEDTSAVARNLVFGEYAYSFNYWLASCAVFDFNFGIYKVGSGCAGCGDHLLAFEGSERGDNNGVRPVISLKSELLESGIVLISDRKWGMPVH